MEGPLWGIDAKERFFFPLSLVGSSEFSHRLSRSWQDGTQLSIWVPTYSSGLPSFLSFIVLQLCSLWSDSQISYPSAGFASGDPQWGDQLLLFYFFSPPLSLTHTYPPLYLCSQACAYTHRHLCSETYTCVYTNAPVFTSTHNICAHTRTHEPVFTYTHTDLYSHKYTCAYAHTNTSTPLCFHIYNLHSCHINYYSEFDSFSNPAQVGLQI